MGLLLNGTNQAFKSTVFACKDVVLRIKRYFLVDYYRSITYVTYLLNNRQKSSAKLDML